MENQLNSINNNGGSGAFDAFLNLLSLISLGWLAHAFGATCFQLINKYLGDLNNYISSPAYYGGLLKYGIASLIVIAPVYFLAINLLHNNYKNGKLNNNSSIYKWLTYLMLLVSSLTIVGSIITLITNFLGGNYTLPFILKILTIVVIAGMIFGYYFYDMRRKDYSKKDKISIIAGSIVVLAVIVAVVGGFLSVETPKQARTRIEDERTSSMLSQVYYFINNAYYSEQELKEDYDFSVIFYDYDLSNSNISYRKISEQEYELCADFKADGTGQIYGEKTVPWFKHDSGRQCYLINAKKEYDKNNKIIQKTEPREIPEVTAPSR